MTVENKIVWKDVWPIVTLLLAIGGTLLAAGQLMGRVNDNSRRIDKLELRADQRDAQLSDLQKQLAGISAKLDLLLERPKPHG